MKSRLELSPYQRLLCSVIAVALLFWGLGGKGRVGLGRFFGILAAFYLILYVAGGGRVPWKISRKDYLLYVVISLSMVAAAVLYAYISVHRGR
jgi:hypothetical protein